MTKCVAKQLKKNLTKVLNVVLRAVLDVLVSTDGWPLLWGTESTSELLHLVISLRGIRLSDYCRIDPLTFSNGSLGRGKGPMGELCTPTHAE